MGFSKGQTHVIEALLAITILSAVMITVVEDIRPVRQLETPEDKKVENEIRNDAEVVLDKSHDQGYLKSSILNWNEDIDRMDRRTGVYQTGSGLYTNYSQLNSTLGNRLVELRTRHSDAERGIGINVELIPAENGTRTSEKNTTLSNSNENATPFMVTGSISQQSLVVTETVVLYGDDRLQAPPEAHQTDSYGVDQATTSNGKQLHELTEQDRFTTDVIPPKNDYSIDENEIYNVVEVRTIIWF